MALSANVQTVANHVTLDEQKHVAFLRTALGSAAVAKPAINLDALNLGFRNEGEFLALSRAFEDLGVTAYGGAAKLIDNAAILEAAARIALTEAQHAGVFRYLIALANVAAPADVDGASARPGPSTAAGGLCHAVRRDADFFGVSLVAGRASPCVVGGARGVGAHAAHLGRLRHGSRCRRSPIPGFSAMRCWRPIR